MERAKLIRKKVEQTPPPSEWKKEFGDKCKLSPDGRSFDLTVRSDSDIRKAHEMQEGARKIEVEQGHVEQARMSRERVIRKGDGRMIEFPEELLEQAKHKFRPAGRNGGAPSERFSISDSARGYERGPGGLYFKWDGGWLPVNLWRNGALSPQKDPDGNVWVEVDGEWSLMDEVS